MKKLLIIVIGVLLVGCSMEVETPVNYKDKLIGTWTNKYIDYPTLSTDPDQYQLIITENTIQLRIRRENGIYSGTTYSFDNCDESMIYFTGPVGSYWQEYKFTTEDEIEFGNTNLGHWWGPWIRIK